MLIIILFLFNFSTQRIFYRHLSDYLIELLSLLGFTNLGSNESLRALGKRNISFNDFEAILHQIGGLVKEKTSQLKYQNDSLKNKQTEILDQNDKLTKAYTELFQSRERFNKLVKALEEEYYLFNVNCDFKIDAVSESVETVLGYSQEEFLENHLNIPTSNPVNTVAHKLREEVKLGNSQSKYLFEVYHKNGSIRMLEITEIPVLDNANCVTAIEGVAHDITMQYTSDERIREQEEKYRRVFNSASDFIFLFKLEENNVAGKFLEANTYTQRFLGYSQKELQEMTPDDLNAAEIWNDSHDREKSDIYERIWETKEGSVINVEIREQVFTIKGKQVCIAVARDITERKRVVEEIKFMNEELVNQKENLEALLDNLTQTQEQLVQSEKMAALGQLIAGVAHEVNTPLGAIKASVGNLSDSLSSLISGMPELFQQQSKEDLELFLKVFQHRTNQAVDLSSREKREYRRLIRKDLTERNIKDADLIADLLVYFDLYNEYKDFLSLLALPEALTVLRHARDFISLGKNTRTISIAADKASKVVFALKKYSHRDSEGERIPTDIVDGIETVLTLYHSQLKQGITLNKNLEQLPIIMCYQDEINQVWTNLIQNAIQAMGTHGTLTVKAYTQRDKIFIEIGDTGHGITPDIKDKIFEPFYTTKKQGEGSGLGLDIVKRIVDKHKGDIQIKTEINKGTTFIVILPSN